MTIIRKAAEDWRVDPRSSPATSDHRRDGGAHYLYQRPLLEQVDKECAMSDDKAKYGILIGVDGSAESDAAIRWATNEAIMRDQQITRTVC